MDQREFTKEFKNEAVRLTYHSQKTVPEIALDLGIAKSTLFRWRREYREEGNQAFRGHGILKAEDEEMRRLKKALKDVTQERDILKKALAIFSGSQRS